MTIPEERAIALAREVASERGWMWKEPVTIRRARTYWLFGRETYEVRTNTTFRGCNARIVIDAEQGAIIEARWLPR